MRIRLAGRIHVGADGVEELGDFERFGEIVVAAAFKAFLAIFERGMGGEGHDSAGVTMEAKGGGGSVAVHFGHLHVHED